MLACIAPNVEWILIVVLQNLERDRKAASEEATAAAEKLRLAMEEAGQQDVEIAKAKKKASSLICVLAAFRGARKQ